MLYGRNVVESLMVKEAKVFMAAVSRGMRCTYIDPRATITACKATRYWQVRPKSDYALNLAIIHEVLDPGVAVSSDFIVGFCGETDPRSSGRSAWSSVPDSRIASSSSTAPARGRRPTNCSPTTSRGREEASEHRVAGDPDGDQFEETGDGSAGSVEVLVEGPSRSTGRREGWDGSISSRVRTACDRIAVFGGPRG